LCERAIVPDLLVGTSIGAINAAAFAGVPTMEGIEMAAQVWCNLAVSDVFPKGRLHGPWRFFERRPSVFSMESLRREVGDFLTYERLEEAHIPLVLVATRLGDASEVWMTKGPALDSVMASAALPGFYPVADIAGERFLDGGVVDNVPISAALAAGARRIFVLLCGSVETPSSGWSRPYEALFAAFTMALNARLRRDLASVPEDVDVVVFEVSGNVAYDPLDFSRAAELIEIGHDGACRAIDEYLRLVKLRHAPSMLVPQAEVPAPNGAWHRWRAGRRSRQSRDGAASPAAASPDGASRGGIEKKWSR
ncbi:MAG: patatin-like phospholipase family protein, partial [Acidimicrobiales bacterium]